MEAGVMTTGVSVNDVLDRASGLWGDHGVELAVGAGTVAAVVILVAAIRFSRSDRKDRWIDRVAAVLVLAWTSEGMWEVATQRLGFPVPFAVATFCVAEAMLLSSAMRASAYRQAHGVPGPSGTAVWVLASVFGTTVALAGDSAVEFLLRIALPLGAVYLWWTGLVTERPSDTQEMREARRRRAEEREATWTVTPRTILVQLGWMKPGAVTTTDAQREHQIRRMVVLADKAALAGDTAAREKAARRVRELSRTADEAMLAEVAERLERARRAELLLSEQPSALEERERRIAELDAELAAATERARAAESAATLAGQAKPEVVAQLEATIETLREQLTNAQAGGDDKADGDQVDLADEVRRLRREHPKWTVAQIAEEAGCSDRTVRRHLNAPVPLRAVEVSS